MNLPPYVYNYYKSLHFTVCPISSISRTLEKCMMMYVE